MSKKKEFDYYIFIDFSENLVGYNIIKRENIKDLLPKILRFRHYKVQRNRKDYIKHIKNTIKREKIKSYFEKTKIKNLRENVDIFVEVSKFVKNHEDCIIFISVDDFQYRVFKKIIELADGDKTRIVKESKLKKDSLEHKLSLVLDNLLNLERKSKK
ncbi:hypothetical protein K9L16_03860 [Candidatus Pacearchaeota archaeon]|nr:hypothetical protein [Candidatus Pacearchaeota archaeon]